MRRLVFTVLILALGSSLTFAQQKPRSETPKQETQLGRGMSLIVPGLMEVGVETNFFLQLADQLQLTEKQRSALEEIAYEAQKDVVQRRADLDVADAELQRLLTRDNINLDAVRAKVKESEAIIADVKIHKIEAVLKAINTLTHDQHLKIVTLSRELLAPKARPQGGGISE